MRDYPRGSEWRKWDLHVHTPLSIVQQYGGDSDASWDAFVQKIASLPPEIKVIGVTDYLFCDGYEKLLSRKLEIPNIDLLIPNIEFRLNTFSGTPGNTKRHNFHILFDPVVSIVDIRDQLLNCLSSAYLIETGHEWQQMPTPRSLEELGRKVKLAAPAGNTVHSKSDLEVGFDNITYKLDDIRQQLKKDCFKGKFVTAIGYSEWDQARWDQSAVEKRNLINNADMCLTNLADPAKISENREDLAKNKLNSLVLHSSDAHKLERLGETSLWIKADPTFAGLKQVLNEPDDRVFIGTTPPQFKPTHKVMKNVLIKNTNGWFSDDFSLELNEDLVAIIGGRGSGKSALAEMIAYGAGSMDNTDDSFIKKASAHKTPVNTAIIEIEWSDESKTEFTIGELIFDHELIRYLPQGAVEELCSPKNSDKLQEQIENVIFQALDETERLGASSFSVLKDRVLKKFEHEKNQIDERLQELNYEIASTETSVASLSAKNKELNESKEELKRTQKNLPKLSAEDQKGQEELTQLHEEKQLFEKLIVEIKNQMSKLDGASTTIKLFSNEIVSFKKELGDILENVSGIDIEDLVKINFNENDIEKTLSAKRTSLSGQLTTLKSGTINDVASLLDVKSETLHFNNLTALNEGIDQKQKQTRAFETQKLQYQQHKKTELSYTSKITALEAEIKTIKEKLLPALGELKTERAYNYIKHFEILHEEKTEIEKLYKPLQDSLLGGSETDKNLTFEAQISYKKLNHIEQGHSLIDRSRRGNFKELESLDLALSEFWNTCFTTDFNEPSIKAAISKVLEMFNTLEGEEITIESQLREGVNRAAFYNWLFKTDNFETISSLKFDDTDLYVLSPGQKGIILLMLYLEIDKEDYRPLIIDQPEENLDNLSVYKDLIKYFRDRKIYRQIIIVTHNPNLVVNTDAEQVIIANYKGNRAPRLKYISGSLEDQTRLLEMSGEEERGIIEQVCDILEGGEPAFKSRKKKYQISRSSKIE